MISLLRDSLILISDTFLFLNSVILNSFYTNKTIGIQRDGSLLYLRPLEQGSIVYYEKIPLDKNSISNFQFRDYENYSNLNFSANAFWKFSVSSNLEQSQGVVASILGNYNQYKVEGVIKSTAQNRTITLEEIEESYLSLSSKDFYLNVGTFLFNNFRIFGINIKKDDYFATFGYEKAQFTRIELYLDEDNRGPYKFSESYNIVYGSVKVYLNGQKLDESDYILDYQVGTITFKPNVIIRMGDKLTIEYQFFESDGQREHLYLDYKNASFYQRRKLLKYESDTIKYIENPGYYPSYYKSDKGSYIKDDTIFVYVGEGKGDYVVRFSPFIGGSYNYNSEGNFYYFVGRGNGNYEPFEYYEPPTLEREFNLEFLKNKITIFEFNKNYYKYQYGDLDFESDLTFNYNNFELGLKRRKRLISNYVISNNLMFSNFGNYIYLKLFYFEPYLLDSLFGVKLDHKNLYFETIKDRRRLNFNFSRDIFKFDYEYLFIDSSFNRISFKTNTQFYPIYNLRYSRTIENEVGFGLNSKPINLLILYQLESRVYQFRLWKSSEIINFDISYITQPDVIYIERYIFVGEGLGSYSYDQRSNTYYPDPSGSYIRQLYPYYLKTSKSELISNVSISYKDFDISFSKNKDNLFFSISSQFNQTTYSKQFNYEELNNVLTIKLIRVRNRYVYQSSDFSYLKNSIGFNLNDIEFGTGIYARNRPFLYFEFRKLLNVNVEYRFLDYNDYIKKGLDLNASLSYVYKFRNYNIVLFGLFGYNEIRTMKNFGVNLSLGL